MTLSDRVQALENSSNRLSHNEKLDTELRSPSPEPIFPQASTNNLDNNAPQDDAELRSPSPEPVLPQPSTNKPDNNAPQDDAEPIGIPAAQFPLKSRLPGAVYAESDIGSVESRSTYSEEESVPQTRRKSRTVMPTDDEQRDIFEGVYEVLDEAFSELETRMNESSEPLGIQDMILKLPVYYSSPLFFGKQPNHSLWEGFIYLNGRFSEIAKLFSREFENGMIYGIEIGGIDNYDGYGDALLFMGQNRLIYLTSSAGLYEEDKDGFMQYRVRGGFDLREMGMSKVLDM